MDNTSLFNTHSIGKNGYYWWIGQIAPEETWKDNQPGKPVKTNKEIKGYGERYRVAIMGYHTQDDIENNKLPWAYVQYPVTAGGGPRGSFQSANLTEGTFVSGFFLDGEVGQIPIITGAIGYNDYQVFSRTLTPDTRFKPASGFLLDESVPYFSVRAEEGGDYYGQSGQKVTPMNGTITLTLNQQDYARKTTGEQLSQKIPLQSPTPCEPVPLSGTQTEIQKAINEINRIQREFNTKVGNIDKDISAVQEIIENKCFFVAKYVAEAVEWIITEIEKSVTKNVNDKTKKFYNILLPNERSELKFAIENSNDAIACVFRKILDSILDKVIALISDLICNNRLVNATACVIENILANLVGSLLSGVSSAVNDALGAVKSILQLVGSFDDLGNLDPLEVFLSYLGCPIEEECPTVTEWSLWSGANQLSAASLTNIIEKAKSVASNIENGFGVPSGLDGLDLGSCFPGPVVCGPPTISFFGDGGVGAAANLVISAVGEVIGVDLISFGVGYGPNTRAKVNDECGIGRGARVKVRSRDENGGIIDVDVEDGGTGYLPAPNGSKGAGGQVWSTPDETSIIRDGVYMTPYPPGEVVETLPGDIVTLPPGTTTETDTGEGIGGPGTGTGGTGTGTGGVPPGSTIIQTGGTFTTPVPDFTSTNIGSGKYPFLGNGGYPVILFLCGIDIVTSGTGYSDNDTIVIEPDNGATAVPKFDRFGKLESVKVTAPGEGFTVIPKVYIQTESGINAQLRPKLCIDRISQDQAKEPEFQDQVITVIDCVGKV